MSRSILLAVELLFVAAIGMASDDVCPGPLSTVDINGHGGIKAAGAVDNLVVAFDQRGITTWSIADPADPVELGHYSIDRERLALWPYDSRSMWRSDIVLDLDGDWACIVPSFDCFDLSDPARPAPQRWGIEEWPCEESYEDCDPFSDFALSRGAMAVVEDEREVWLLELEEERPSRWVRPQGWTDRFGVISSVAFSGDVLLILEEDKTLTAWDLEDPEQPVEVGSGILDTVRHTAEGFALRAHLRGAVALGGNSQGWQELTAISILDLPDLPSSDLTHRLDWDPLEELEFVGDRGVGLMRTWDSDVREWVYNYSEIRVPSAFTMYVRSTIDTEETKLSVTRNHVIGWPGSLHFEVFRLGDQLALAGITSKVGEVLDLDVEGDIGILANGAEGITVLDLSDPENPVPISTLQIPEESVERVRLQDSIAYLLTEGSLASVDLSRPAEPSLIRHREIEGVCCHLELSGETAVVGSREDCTMPLIDISDPTRLLTIADADFCHPGYTETIWALQVVDEIAYVQTNWYFYGIDISDPHQPVKIVNHFDHDYESFHVDSDYLLMTYYNEMRLCQITGGGDVDVGRVYENLSAYGLDSIREDLVLSYAHERQTLIDFSDLIEPTPYGVRMTDNLLPAGIAVGHVWLRPFRNMVDVMSLECRPPEASFRWTGNDLEIWFEDTTRYRVEERLWDFGDGTTSTVYSPTHTYAETGRYHVTITVSNGYGTDTVARNIYLTEPLRREDVARSSEVD